MKRRPGRIPLITRAAAVVAIAVGATLSLVPSASADVSVSQTSSVQVGSPAVLVARGLAINVPVTVMCPPDSLAILDLRVTERVGQRIASGFVFGQNIQCTGEPQNINVLVEASQAGPPFRRGTGFATATLTTLDTVVVDQRTIEIVK